MNSIRRGQVAPPSPDTPAARSDKPMSPRLEATPVPSTGLGGFLLRDQRDVTLIPDRDGIADRPVLRSQRGSASRYTACLAPGALGDPSARLGLPDCWKSSGGPMSASEPIPFACPGCGTKYKVVLIDPSPYEARNATIKCVKCGVALTATKGNALLQYFLGNPADRNLAGLPRRERGR